MDKKVKIKIPFQNGNLVNYPEKWIKDYDWLENYEFGAILELHDIIRGRSAAHFELYNPELNVKYVMFMKDLFDFCKLSKIEDGKLIGKFTFCKRGSNYGIKGVF